MSRRSAAPTVDQLARLGLDVRLRQADLLIAAWSTSIPDPAAQFVRLKTQTWFSAVCPVFEGARGGDLVAIHPRQLIVKARAGSAAPRDIVRELGLTPIEDRGYGLVLTSITAPRSDPTAVFRELHRINLRSSVAFAEPLLLPLPPSPT